MLIDPSQWDLANVDLGNLSVLHIYGTCTTCDDFVPIDDMTPDFQPLCALCGNIAQLVHTTSSKPSEDTQYGNALRRQRAGRHPLVLKR